MRIVGEEVVDFLPVEGEEVEPHFVHRVDPPNSVVVVLFLKKVFHVDEILVDLGNEWRRIEDFSDRCALWRRACAVRLRR